MELPDVGKQCSHPDCKQLDFLPLPCKKCCRLFCSDHFGAHASACEAPPRPEVQPRKITDAHKCSRADCNETSVVPLVCERCLLHFCVRHRHLAGCSEKDPRQIAEEREKYDAPVRQFNEAKTNVDRLVEKKLNQARKGRNKETANKVQLMKLKNKATGSRTVPVQDRVYFNVTHPGGEKVTPVFVSKAWTVGRTVDAVAVECKLRNDNNKSDAKKLKLFRKETGEIIAREVANGLESALNEGTVVNGEDLVIQYVDDGCERLPC